MKRMGINEFEDKLFTGKLSRRQAVTTMIGAGLVPVGMGMGARGARAAQQPLVFTWSGYEVPELHPAYVAAHGEPEFSFFASEQEAATKMRAGFPADLVHPCSDTWVRMGDAGILKPVDTSRLSNWADVFPGLASFSGIRNADGDLMMVPLDWGNSSIIYRTDLYEGEESWCMLFDDRYAGRLSSFDSESALVVAGLCKGYGSDVFSMTDEMLQELRPLIEKQVKLVRFYWSDQSEVESAMASGEIVAAYAWNSALKTLKDQGIPVAYAQPKEGILTWLCGMCIGVNGQGDEDLVYDYLDAWLAPEAGKFLIEDYGYGHSNAKSFELADPQKVADLGFPENPEEMLSSGIMFQPQDPAMIEKEVNMFDEIKISM
jgi:spermidine/putrescine transport system substrate-binding protein